MNTIVNTKPANALRKKRHIQNVIFYAVMAGIPIVQVCVFYIGVNINSILLAFRKYDMVTMTYSWNGLNNFKQFFDSFSVFSYMKAAVKNSFIIFFSTIMISFSGGIIMSFYIYKKRFLSKFFRVMLFMPSMISSIVMVTIFSHFADSAVPAITNNATVGLLANPDTTFITMLVFTLWLGFGGGMLVYTGTMNGISESLVEAAKLDGCGTVKEFIFITIPSIYPTIIVFLVGQMSNFFANQMNLFAFYGADADYRLYSFGYWLYVSLQRGNMATYPYLSAVGLVLTAFLAPIVLVTRKLLLKLGPSSD